MYQLNYLNETFNISILYYNNETKKFIVHYLDIQEILWYTYSEGNFEIKINPKINYENIVTLMLFYQLDENNNQELQGQQL